MIKGFRHKGLKKLFNKGDTSGVMQSHVKKLRNILVRLDAAKTIQDMNSPGSNLHQLTGDLDGQWAVKVNGNWRVFFEFENGNAYLVDYDDYH
ncbi:MAG: type II toxin-antitoxin system RelE/ParE family toxin [Algicola sp.]|nr:type II toxin-antitoxin system RelE/ParE family toxin [Algicola sp.]